MIVKEMIFTHEMPEDLENRLKNYLVDPDEPEDNGVRVINPDGRNRKPKQYDMDAYFEAFDMDTELLIGEPYDTVYLFYIDQQISMAQNEISRYNKAATMYDNAMATLHAYWNRTYMPLQFGKPFLQHDRL